MLATLSRSHGSKISALVTTIEAVRIIWLPSVRLCMLRRWLHAVQNLKAIFLELDRFLIVITEDDIGSNEARQLRYKLVCLGACR